MSDSFEDRMQDRRAREDRINEMKHQFAEDVYYAFRRACLDYPEFKVHQIQRQLFRHILPFTHGDDLFR